MAHKIENDEQGYDPTRFEHPVPPVLLCSICHRVLRNPRMCHDEHMFCLVCILRHLRNSATCPTCRTYLTQETLKCVPRFVRDYLLELKIICNYKDLGCPYYVELENLGKHVDQCQFAPATTMMMNVNLNDERDEHIHDEDFCQMDIREKNIGTEAKIAGTRKKQDEMNDQVNQMKTTVDGIKHCQGEIKPRHDVMTLNRSKDQFDDVSDKVGQTNPVRFQENVDQMKTIQAEIKADQVTWKAEVRQQFERMTEVLNELRQRNNVNNNAVQAVDPGAQAHSATDQEIVILGGFYCPRGDEVSNTVEIFNVAEGNSVELPPMNTPRAESGSCVYHNDVIVAGGYDGQTGTDSIEIFRMNQRFLQWVAFEGSLPVKLSGHVIIVYQGKLLVIGGYNWNEMKTSDAIYEICLTPPYDSNLLARMPEPRTKHRVELVNGKLFIFGGTTTLSITDVINSVDVYDFITNQVQQYPSLPRPVCGMSTVTCGNMIILVGGMDENGYVLDDVIIYDTATGRKLQLPSMTHKRYGATAVIVRDVIVVFGGWNEEQGYLNTVERFAMEYGGGNEVMNERRSWATAVPLP